MKLFTKTRRTFNKLHLGLYFLFSLMVGLGSTTAYFFEKYSLIDIPLVKSELEHAAAARAKGGGLTGLRRPFLKRSSDR